MNSASSSRRLMSTETLPSERLFELGLRAGSGLALLFYGLVFWEVVSGQPLGDKPGWAAALLVITITLATLAAAARQLPGSKVLLAAIIVGLVGGIAHAIGGMTGIPFGPIAFTTGVGPRLFGKLSWAMPLLWIIAALNARGVARLILKPWRKLKYYGFWVIGVATALVVLLDLALEPFATRVLHFWIWLPTKFSFTWHGMPWTNPLGWALTSLLMFAFATPLLINRQSRSRKLPPDYHPLITWVLMLILFGTGAAMEKLWSATGLCAVIAIASSIFAIRGARW